jgi:plasmid stabilization system protein ParE
MSRKVIILNAAKPDFREIRNHVQTQFGGHVWKEVNEEFKSAIANMGLHPEHGRQIEEIGELMLENFRIRLVRQTRIIYEYDENEVLIHMFIHARRDFRTHLLKRLLHS